MPANLTHGCWLAGRFGHAFDAFGAFGDAVGASLPHPLSLGSAIGLLIIQRVAQDAAALASRVPPSRGGLRSPLTGDMRPLSSRSFLSAEWAREGLAATRAGLRSSGTSA